MRISRTVLAVVVALAVTAAPAAAKKPKPDLAIDQAEFTGGLEAIRGEANALEYFADTENRGRGRAKRSQTAISFVPDRTGPGARPIPGFSMKVRALPGHDPHGNTFSYQDTVESPPLSFDGHSIGTYTAIWCADAKDVVKEKNERNNCLKARLHEESLNLTKRTWTGTVSGSAPVNELAPGNARQSWVSNDARLVLGTGYAEDTDPATYRYGLVGTVEWTVQGTDGRGCEWSGGGTGFFDGTKTTDGSLYVDLDRGLYGGIHDAPATFMFPATRRCGDTTTARELVPAAPILNTITPDDRPFDYQGETMVGSGSQALGGSGGSATDPNLRWTWDFR